METSDTWCFNSHGITTKYDLSPCVLNGIVMGIIPAVIGILSLFILVLSFKKNCGRSVSLGNDSTNVSIREAEDKVISDTLEQVGLSWGGFTLSKYAPANVPKDSSWKTPILSSQRRKDILVLLLCLLMLIQLVVKIGLVTSPATSSELKQGSSWLLILFAVWVYFTVLAFIRIRASTSLFKTSTYDKVEKHLQFFFVLYLIPEIIELRSSILRFVASESTPLLLVLDVLSMFFALCFFVLEFMTARSSPWKDIDSTETNVDVQHIQNDQPQALEIGSSLLSNFSVSYYSNFILKFWNKKPQYSDVPDFLPSDSAITLVQRYRHDVSSLKSGGLILKLFWHMRKQLFIQFLWNIQTPFAIVLPSVLIKYLLDSISTNAAINNDENDPDYTPRHILFFTIVLIAFIKYFDSIASAQTTVISWRISFWTRSILQGEIFAKSLRRSECAVNSETSNSGKIQTYFTYDAGKASRLTSYFVHFYTMPPVLIFTILMLYNVLGLASLAGIAVLAVSFILSTVADNKIAYYLRLVRNCIDERINFTTEVMQSIKTIKFFSWENHFIDKMNIPREKELKALGGKYMPIVTQMIILNASTSLVAVASFTVHTLVLGRPLTASTAFTSLTLFNALKVPMDVLANKVTSMNVGLTSLRKIEGFLNEEETDKYDILLESLSSESSDSASPRIGFKNAKFMWPCNDNSTSHSQNFFIDVGDLTFPEDKLSIIVGHVGSGKTSLLLALLGEMHRVDGEVFLPSKIMRDILPGSDPNHLIDGTVAYCSQKPWLSSNTIRDNVLFGSEFDPKRFDDVIQATALDEDFETMELKDLTQIGQRGIILSGGQKARVSLARALYSSAKVVLLDDVLSAVDARTAEHLVTHALTGPMMKNRTCIMVTHQVSLCAPIASFVVCMDQGRVEKYGDPQQVGLQIQTKKEKQREVDAAPTSAPVLGVKDKASLLSDKQYEERKREHYLRLKKSALKKEETKSGSVPWSVYAFYFNKFGGKLAFAVVFILFSFYQISEVAVQWWLRIWAQSSENNRTHKKYSPKPEELHDTLYYLKIYVILIAVSIFFLSGRTAWYFYRALHAGRKVYNTLVRQVMGSPMSFFEKTMEGNIVTRLVKDAQFVDNLVYDSFLPTTVQLFSTLGAIGAIAFVIPSFLILAFVLFVVYSIIGYIYAGPTRELTRYSFATRTSFYQILNEGVAGVLTIRAFGDTGRFIRDMFTTIDTHNRPDFLGDIAPEWFKLRFQIASAIIVLFATSAALIKSPNDASTVGFVISFALVAHGKLYVLVQHLTELDILFSVVEKVKEYCDLPQEKEDGDVPAAHWPSAEGEISVNDLCVKYGEDLNDVLHSLSFTIKPREKVAIVGRTGSGKSTLALSFFRFVEASKGNITIDGVDISKVKLSELRNRIPVLPQDFTLFTGTIRYNLDPFSEHEDIELWEILRKIGMAADASDSETSDSSRPSTINSDENRLKIIKSLDMQVEDAGKNFSMGQKQLLSLARGLLRAKNSSMVILDEPTSSLDQFTDEKVQYAIREMIPQKATTICIAHRISTIIEYDKVLVLGEGKILEYDEPASLLEQPNSVFRQLCLSTGDGEVLEQIARKARLERRKS